MKIVLANRYFYPDQSATSRMVSSLAFSLARQGFQVTALASRHYHNKGDEILPQQETINGVSVHRLATTGFGRKRLIGRMLDYASFHVRAAAWWLKNTRRDDICVLCTDPPFLSATASLPLALRGAHPVNWVMDLFPETALELGVVPDVWPIRPIAVGIRNWSHRRASLTICPTSSMARFLARQGTGAERIAVVNHWSDGDEIHPVAREDNPLRREWGLNDVFVVGYSGNFGRAHEFDTLLAAAERLREEDDVRFLLIGDGQRRAAVEAEVKRRQLTNVLFKPFQPSAVLSESLGASDVHLVSLLPSLEHCIVPSKFYGVLAAGRPTLFVGATDGEVAMAVRSHACGEAVVPGDVDGLVTAILRLSSDTALRMSMGANARRLMESGYARQIGVAAWLSAISPLIPARAPSAAIAIGDKVTT
ncbi:glycosyltransferase family 4 protein [Mesorhizobium sp. CAU 1732]|uniref:glycosyltransferase family 4 protein n=1 Tax=Mesorhizobium sp. CAU 1732 TaxID=3140358 RepID=UPI003260DE83